MSTSPLANIENGAWHLSPHLQCSSKWGQTFQATLWIIHVVYVLYVYVNLKMKLCLQNVENYIDCPWKDEKANKGNIVHNRSGTNKNENDTRMLCGRLDKKIDPWAVEPTKPRCWKQSCQSCKFVDRSQYRCLITLRCRGLGGQVNTLNSLLCPFKPFLIHFCSVAECIILLKEASGVTTGMKVGCSG